MNVVPGTKIVVESAFGVGIPWKGGARVDGELWPAQDDDTLWLPAGPHAVEPAPPAAGPRLVQLTGDLRAVRASGPKSIEFSYQSGTRAIAIVSRKPTGIEVDGVEQPLSLVGTTTLLLPRGQHVVTLTTD